MRTLARFATASVSALALAVPATVAVGAAHAAPSDSAASDSTASDSTASDVLARKAAGKLKLKKAAAGTHYGLAGNKITAQVRGKGKVTFTVNGTKVKKKIKKGKASFRLPSELAPGTYKVKAKYKKAKGTIKTVVWDSALNVNEAVFTVSAATPSYDLPELFGQVKYKGKVPDKGYVDIYLDGKNKGGMNSPNYCCMAGVNTDGTFNFRTGFLSKVVEKGPGTYQFRAFYTPTSSFDEYIYSAWITVTVTP